MQRRLLLKADMYALGVILWELLTLEIAFRDW